MPRPIDRISAQHSRGMQGRALFQVFGLVATTSVAASSPSAATISAATAAIASAEASTTATATTSGCGRSLSCFVHGKRAALHGRAVQSVDRFLGLLFGRHLDESESLGLPSVSVRRDVNVRHLAVLAK